VASRHAASEARDSQRHGGRTARAVPGSPPAAGASPRPQDQASSRRSPRPRRGRGRAAPAGSPTRRPPPPRHARRGRGGGAAGPLRPRDAPANPAPSASAAPVRLRARWSARNSVRHEDVMEAAATWPAVHSPRLGSNADVIWSSAGSPARSRRRESPSTASMITPSQAARAARIEARPSTPWRASRTQERPPRASPGRRPAGVAGDLPGLAADRAAGQGERGERRCATTAAQALNRCTRPGRRGRTPARRSLRGARDSVGAAGPAPHRRGQQPEPER